MLVGSVWEWDRGWEGGGTICGVERHGASALEEDHVLRLQGLDDALCCLLVRALWRDVHREVGHSFVCLVLKPLMSCIVETEEQNQWRARRAVISSYCLRLSFGKGVLPNHSAEVGMAHVCEVGGVAGSGSEVIDGDEGGAGVGEGGGEEGVVGAQEGEAVERGAGEIVLDLVPEFAGEH